ncbi:MAG: hypothetical protein WC549_00355 [Actinomycetota bacterium]
MENTSLPRFINQKCGLCNGFGTLKYGTITCQACYGKGIVVIDQKTGIIVESNVGRTDKEEGNPDNIQ